MKYPNFADFRELTKAPGSALAPALSAWIKEPGLRIYIRGPHFARGADFILANIEANKPGAGALTRWLDEYEPQFRFYIENVLNPRLERWLALRGYTVVKLPGLRGVHMIGPERSR